MIKQMHNNQLQIDIWYSAPFVLLAGAQTLTQKSLHTSSG
tara:strand:- start:952 stop:1071 length:120 start_codon:yes stop_codon:yes gene_type:complete